MSRLDKRAREWIFEQMEEMQEIVTEDVMELLRPHFDFDVDKAREQDLRRKTHRMMAKFKDEKGVRSFFACHDDDGTSKYINIDTTTDIDALNAVEKQISLKFRGLSESKKKIELQRIRLVQQITLFEIEE